jgi:hypothetical protein
LHFCHVIPPEIFIPHPAIMSLDLVLLKELIGSVQV